MDELEELYFRGYYFDPSWPQTEVPAPEDIEIPDFEFEYDVPTDDLGILSRLVPDEIELSYETPSVDLPEELETTIQIRNELEEAAVSGTGGIGTTIDERMDGLSADLPDLDEQDDTVRELVSDGLSTGILIVGEVVKGIIDALENVGSLLDDLSTISALFSLAAVFGASLAVATGVGAVALLGAAALAAKASAVLGLLAVAINAPQIKIGMDYMSHLTTVHGRGAYTLANTRLGGVDL